MKKLVLVGIGAILTMVWTAIVFAIGCAMGVLVERDARTKNEDT